MHPVRAHSLAKTFGAVALALLLASPAWAGEAFDAEDATARQLLKFLDHPDWHHRYDAIKEIGKRKLLQSEGILVEIAVEDPYERVRKVALSALVKIGSKQAMPVAEHMAMKDDAEHLRERAMGILEKHGTERSAPALGFILLKDNEADLRRKAAIILKNRGWFGQDDAIATAAAEDKSEAVREAAREALILVGGKKHRAAIHQIMLKDPDGEVREEIVRKIEKGPVAMDRGPLVKALKDPNPHVARHAARALVKLGDRSVATLLREMSLDAVDPKVAEEFSKAAANLDD